MKNTLELSVIIPAKDEQDNVKPLIDEICTALRGVLAFEIIYIDDGSQDATYARLKSLCDGNYPELRPIRHRFSVGQSAAIYSGVQQASGRLIVTLDADGQNNPADIPGMLNEANRMPDGVDFCVTGYRKKRKDTPWRRFQSRFANNIRSRMLGDNTPDSGCGLRITPRSTFLKLPYFDHMHRFMPALVKRVGGIIVTVEVTHRDRQFGQSKYNMLGRLGVGIIDLLGVMWLQRRSHLPEIRSDDD